MKEKLDKCSWFIIGFIAGGLTGIVVFAYVVGNLFVVK